MGAYLFLVGVAFVWSVFAVVQDLRSREVANWLTFSLVAVALSYRAFYAISSGQLWFFTTGLIGWGIAFVLALGFYYGRVFAGGDAKLLMGFGALLPVADFSNSVLYVITFILLLFLVGAGWSLVYSIGLVWRNWRAFKPAFNSLILKRETLLLVACASVISIFMASSFSFDPFFWFSGGIIFLLPFLYVYLKALERSCMIKTVSAFALTEGDWLERDVRVRGRWIRKSVHGLSMQEIMLLRKARKNVTIKEGVPFTPAFLGALLIMVYAFATLGLDWVEALAW